MIRAVVGAGLLVWLGATLLLSASARFSRPSLTDRLRPFAPGATRPSRDGALSVESLRDVVGPLAHGLGDRLAGVFGITEPLALRLRRTHAGMDPTAFRTRQIAASCAGAVPALLLAAVGLPALVVVVALVGGPLLVFLVIEQRLSSASAAWQEQLARELPVVSEQLAMLLNAGYSLGAGINRLATRGHGCASTDLAGVANRIRQGVGEERALREWAQLAKVDTLDRLVSVLALNAEASDLGRLVSAEARHARREVQRRTTELIERRAQQVWVPVTVATLVPGVILLAVPFLAALRLFSNA